MKPSISNIIDIGSVSIETGLELIFINEGISAGFPSPALDFMNGTIDLNKHLIKHPSATFYGRVKGMSLKNAGITDGDILIIDRSLEPVNGKIVVCFLEGEFTAKRLKVDNNQILLMPENHDYSPIEITETSDLIIWGIVTHVIKNV